MSTKVKCLLILIAAAVLAAVIAFFCWLHVDGEQLPLPNGDGISGTVTRLQIGFDAASGTATHDTDSFDMTDAQVAQLLQLLRGFSYRRTRYENSVSFDGDMTYAISLAYQDGARREILMLSILDNGLLHCGNSFGYLQITDPNWLAALQAILEQ